MCLVFLGPTTNLKLDFSILRAVDNSSKIHTYDWCSYVFKRVLERCKKLKNNTLVGYWPVLFVTYFHRYNFRDKQSSALLHLIQHWDEESLQLRVDHEVKINCLGSASVSSIQYPLSSKRKGWSVMLGSLRVLVMM